MKEVNGNGLDHIVSQAIEEMKHEQGDNFSLEKINLAELGRRTGLTRAKLRKLKRDGFVVKPHGLLGRKASQTVLTGYTVILDNPYSGYNQRSGLFGAAAGSRFSGWFEYCQGLYRCSSVPCSRQKPARSTAG